MDKVVRMALGAVAAVIVIFGALHMAVRQSQHADEKRRQLEALGPVTITRKTEITWLDDGNYVYEIDGRTDSGQKVQLLSVKDAKAYREGDRVLFTCSFSGQVRVAGRADVITIP